jgi:four helix bundle protein
MGREYRCAMKDPDKLRVAQAAEELAVLIYEYTAGFPREERYGLAAQLRRTAVSIGSNIFEGCGRITERGFRASLGVSHGETTELLFQIRLSVRLSFGDRKLGSAVRKADQELGRMLFNLIAQMPDDQ